MMRYVIKIILVGHDEKCVTGVYCGIDKCKKNPSKTYKNSHSMKVGRRKKSKVKSNYNLRCGD